MDVLDDIVAVGLDLVVVGSAVGPCAAERGHHYAQRGDAFWRLLRDSGLTPTLLRPPDERSLLDHGIGLADVVRRLAHGIGLADVVRRLAPPDPFDVDALWAVLDDAAPRWVAFNGRVGADAVARALGEPRPTLGPHPWTVAGARVFVLPSSSGANQRSTYGGRPDRLAWWAELAASVQAPNG